MTEADQLVKQGVRALKAGQKKQARALLEQALSIDDRHELAWLWMSAIVENPQEQEICLENVLTINPDNQHAQKGLQKVRKKLASQAPKPPEPEPEPVEEEEEFDFFTETESTALAEAPPAEAAVFAKKDKPFPGDFERMPQRGILQLLDAWTAALMFNRRDAYAAELPVATIGRTMMSVVLSTVVATLVLAVGFVFGLTQFLTWVYSMAGTNLPPTAVTPASFLAEGSGFALEATVISAPFLVISFFAIAFGMYLAAKVFGSGATFYDHAHIFSIAYSPTIIVSAIFFTILIIAYASIMSSVNINLDEVQHMSDAELTLYFEQEIGPYNAIFSILSGLFLLIQLYTALVWGQALGTVHSNGIVMGCITVIGGSLLSAVCIFPATCCLLSNLMSL